jgi:hypothetical protein|tara:strand:+ start:405 stop:785 length:381 start_codon:yes stop_codon:yes gene_type:complete
MFTEFNILNSGLWFFGGALCYRGFSVLLGNAYGLLIAQDSIDQALKLLFSSEASFKAILNLKYEALRKTDNPYEEIDKIKEIDNIVLSTWKSFAITNLVYSCPKYYRSSIKFRNWEQAKKYFTDRG